MVSSFTNKARRYSCPHPHYEGMQERVVAQLHSLLILALDGGWVVTFMPWQLFPQEKLQNQLNTVLGGSQTHTGHLGEKKNLPSLSGFKSCTIEPVVYSKGAQMFKKSNSHWKILGTRRVTWNKIYIEDPRMLGAAMQNLVAMVTWPLGFVQPVAYSLYWLHYPISFSLKSGSVYCFAGKLSFHCHPFSTWAVANTG